VANILSQDEVDALLRSFQEEEGSIESEENVAEPEPAAAASGDRRIRIYDFRRPNRISKEQLRYLQTLHETYAFGFGGVLSGYLRTLVEISIISVEQYSYGEWIKGLKDSTCLFHFGLEPDLGKGAIEIDSGLVLGFVDRLLGGRGETDDVERELTDLETTVVSRVVEDGLRMLGDAWHEVVSFEAQLRGHERHPHLLRLLADTEPVVLVTMDLKTKAHRGRMTICYPFVALEAGLTHVTGSFAAQPLERNHDPHATAWLQSGLQEGRVTVSACLGHGAITIGEFIHLRPGDVLRLETQVEQPMTVQVAGRSKFLARPGRRDRRLAVQISHRLTAGQEGEKHVG